MRKALPLDVISGTRFSPLLVSHRPQSHPVFPACSAAQGREVQADEDDHRGPPSPGQVHAPRDLTDREGPTAGTQRSHHQDQQMGAPETSRLQSQGEGWWTCSPCGWEAAPCGLFSVLLETLGTLSPRPKMFCAALEQILPRVTIQLFP